MSPQRAHDGVLSRVRRRALRCAKGQAQGGERRLMAYQQATRYCGRCGAPLAPGATYCGRCGTPAALNAVGAPPIYRYPSAHPARPYRLAPALIAGGFVLILIALAVAIGGPAALCDHAGGHFHLPATSPPTC